MRPNINNKTRKVNKYQSKASRIRKQTNSIAKNRKHEEFVDIDKNITKILIVGKRHIDQNASIIFVHEMGHDRMGRNKMDGTG